MLVELSLDFITVPQQVPKSRNLYETLLCLVKMGNDLESHLFCMLQSIISLMTITRRPNSRSISEDNHSHQYSLTLFCRGPSRSLSRYIAMTFQFEPGTSVAKRTITVKENALE